MNRRKDITAATLLLIESLFPNNRNKDIAKLCNVSEGFVRYYAAMHGLEKSPKYIHCIRSEAGSEGGLKSAQVRWGEKGGAI